MGWKEYCVELWLKELQESMDSCTGHSDITEILLKMALNTIQSINQSYYIDMVSFIMDLLSFFTSSFNPFLVIFPKL